MLSYPIASIERFKPYFVLESQKLPLIATILARKGPVYNLLEKSCLENNLIYDYKIKGSREVLNGEYCFVRIQQADGNCEWRIAANSNGVSLHMRLLDSLEMPVIFAGTMLFQNNQLIHWNNASGSFRLGDEAKVQAGLPLELYRGI